MNDFSTTAATVSAAAPWPALLLIGPTASGKTPLGDRLQETGLDGRRHAHFDFGVQLRAAASGGAAAQHLTRPEIAIVTTCLRTGALLENETFGIAQKLLVGFAASAILNTGDRLILNGLPRHRAQARMLAPLTQVERVLELDCDAETVMARVRSNSGGDRNGRGDDTDAAIRRRLQIYRSRTRPLIDFYRQAGAQVARLQVEPDSTPESLLSQL